MLSQSLPGTETRDAPPAHRGPHSIHVLNTASGKPAAGVSVLLTLDGAMSGGRWADRSRRTAGSKDIRGAQVKVQS